MNKKIKKFILKVLGYVRYKKSYSQDGEDVVLLSFFEGKKNYKGFYIDVGAHHPTRFSNTKLFYNNGWSGINIDPTPGSMFPFRLLRSRDVNLEIGISEIPTVLTFFCFNEPALNTFDKHLAKERNVGNPYRLLKTVDIPVEPLGDILHKYLPHGQKIDFLTIDVEGLDLEVLKSNNWSEYVPEFILVEDLEFQPEKPDQSATYHFLKSKNYKIVACLKRTIIYQYST